MEINNNFLEKLNLDIGFVMDLYMSYTHTNESHVRISTPLDQNMYEQSLALGLFMTVVDQDKKCKPTGVYTEAKTVMVSGNKYFCSSVRNHFKSICNYYGVTIMRDNMNIIQTKCGMRLRFGRHPQMSRGMSIDKVYMESNTNPTEFIRYTKPIINSLGGTFIETGGCKQIWES